MDTKELIKKVRKIEIKTKGLSNQIFSGEYHSAFKGRGMAFSEVRDYAVGDEIRTIDWNVTARFNEPFVKVFEEERELTVMLIVDVSGSEMFGTRNQIKRETITELCAVLAFSAVSNNDRIGLIMFSEQIEMFIPPKKGKSHILRIIRELINYEPKHKGTNISEALKYFSKMVKKKSIAFVVSDFLSDDFSDAIKIASRKHDVVALKVQDKAEQELPNVGVAQFKDLETGEVKWINTSSKKVRDNYKKAAEEKNEASRKLFRRSKTDFAEIYTDEGYIKPLMNLFKNR
ncbi:DUF58 domain-containing protein [Paracrocinitomix mangrovi]|uniref:DUF58 domain-containing protein n=1 Tax=Paracrocinitomix mangrovi TaxID=2862509 RepID=UPI001C8E91CA|nr:DUF58 domain-containing protein [Paracrocinitomix mangrovi]UKN01315.1 DUF58 domain-containing protein [Paracrocinitomix mangrovi]